MSDEPDPKPEAKPEEEEAELASEAAPPEEQDRREFLVKAGSVVFGGLVVVAPVGAGLTTLISPMLSKTADGQNVRLATIGDLPADGTPKRFDVVAVKTDGWMKYPPKPIGGVYLRKVGDSEVMAFNSSCPHAGCSVNFKPELKGFHCPCHDSTFEIDGSRGKVCVSARGLDVLQVDEKKLTETGEIWVTFVNYKAGVSEENKAL